MTTSTFLGAKKRKKKKTEKEKTCQKLEIIQYTKKKKEKGEIAKDKLLVFCFF